MRTLLDKNSTDTTALNNVVDQESVKYDNKEAKILTYFVLKRHSPTSSLRFLDQTETEGHLKQIDTGLGQATLSRQEKDPGIKLQDNSRSSRFDLKNKQNFIFPREPEVQAWLEALP